MSTQIVFAVRPGDAVTIQGRKTAANPVVAVVSVTNDASGAVVKAGPPGLPQQLDDESRIKLQLHDLDGHINGVLLEDGTIVRMLPPDAEQDAAGLAVGQLCTSAGMACPVRLARRLPRASSDPPRLSSSRSMSRASSAGSTTSLAEPMGRRLPPRSPRQTRRRRNAADAAPVKSNLVEPPRSWRGSRIIRPR
jgi:hypothetical protein